MNLFVCFLQKLHGFFRVAFRFSYRPPPGVAAKWENLSLDSRVNWSQTDNEERLSRKSEGFEDPR